MISELTTAQQKTKQPTTISVLPNEKAALKNIHMNVTLF